MSLPGRYRFIDLFMSDFAFTDDGQRWDEWTIKVGHVLKFPFVILFQIHVKSKMTKYVERVSPHEKMREYLNPELHEI